MTDFALMDAECQVTVTVGTKSTTIQMWTGKEQQHDTDTDSTKQQAQEATTGQADGHINAGIAGKGWS